jgi:hypothetical protein
MKCSTVAMTFAIAAITALTLAVAPIANAEDKGCSDASLQGTFAYTSTGFIVAAPISSIVGPAAEVGTLEFDGKGDVKFTFNSSQNGNVGPGTATGSYKVKEDCTGTFTEAYSDFTANFSFVIDKGRDEFQAICQDPGVVDTRIGRKLRLRDDWR